MAGTMVLSKVLDSSEISSLTDVIKDKLDTYLTTQEQLIDEHKAKYEKIRVNSEQRYFEVEKQLKDSNSKLEQESSSNTFLKQRVEELEKKYQESSEKLKVIQGSQEDNVSTTSHLTKINQQLETEKRDLGFLLEKRNREIDSLNDELKEFARRTSEANTAKCEAAAKLDELRSQDVNKEYQVKRLEQEKENVQRELEWVRKDLQEKTTDLLTMRREKSTRLLEIQFKLEEKTEEASLLQATVDSLKKSSADQITKIESFIQKIKDLQDSHSQSDEQYQQEIQARARLADLYKQSSLDAESQVTELTGAVKELQNLLKEAATAHTKMEKEKDEFADTLSDQIQERESKIEKLKQELVHSNDLLEAMRAKGVSGDTVDAMFPTAATTSKMLKSGMTLTEIYNEYVLVSDSLQREKDENQRLNSYLDQILQEIEEKAPILKAQRTDYENALQSIDRMTSQLTSGMMECKSLRLEADEKHRKLTHLQRENQKHQQQTQDLSSQVRYLVKEIEEIKGGRIVRDETVSSSENLNSSAIISQSLVTFRDIEEMQGQNQKLLAVIRDLSDKREEEESATLESKTHELKEELNNTLTELNELKEARDRQVDLVESLVRQRDMYRVLLQQSGPQNVGAMATSTPFPSGRDQQARTSGVTRVTGTITNEKFEETNKALKELQADFTKYKKEKLENEKIMTVQYDKTKQEVADLRVQNAKFSSRVESASERNKALQNNTDSYRKEIALLRDRIQKYSTSVAKHELTINSLREDLMAAHEKLAQSEARLQFVQQEKDLIRTSEQRKTFELEALRRESSSQTVLMANLQAIQNNLERNEYETKQRYGKQIQILERDNHSLNKRLETEEKHHAFNIKQLETKIQEIRKTLDLELNSHQATKDKMNEATAQVVELQEQVKSTKSNLSSVESQLSRYTGETDGVVTGSGDELRDLKAQLTQRKAEIESLQEQLKSARKHTEQYKTLAQSVQESIQQQNQTSKEFQDSLERKLNEAVEVRTRLEQTVTTLEQERQELLTENVRINEASHSLNADLRKQLSSCQNELQEAVETRKTALEQEASAKQDKDLQNRLASEAQEKYERELMLHAADVEALTTVKKELEDFNTRLRTKEEAANKAETLLAESQTKWKQREEILDSNCQKENSRVKELIAQTRALHEQMGKLAHQVISVQERAASSGKPGTSVTAADDSSKSSDQLLEVVRYLRKEKDIAEGKLDVIETESTRLKQRCDHLEKQLEEANKTLLEEREKSQADMQTVAQHADLMHKVESNNLLQDSNRMLREEKEQLSIKMQEAEAKIRKLEESIQPLQEELRSLQHTKEQTEVDRKALADEMERWKARTNTLIEQSQKTDPEEYKRVMLEKEAIRKQLLSTKEELIKTKSDAKNESTRLNMDVARLQKLSETLRQGQTKLSDENTTLKQDSEEKGKDVDEKVKTITQLKKIGRKYKEQAEKVCKEFDDYKGKQEGHQQQQINVQQASTKQLEVLEQKLKEADGKREQTEQTMKDLKTEKEEVEQKLKDLEAKLKDAETEQEQLNQKLKEAVSKQEEMLQQKSSASDHEVNKLREDLQSTQQKCTQMSTEVDTLKEEKAETDKKLTQSNKVIQMAKVKIQSTKDTSEKLTSENSELKQKMLTISQTSSEEAELRLKTLKSQYENKISKLAEINELKESASTDADSQATIARLQTDNSELQGKVQQLQRQLENTQKIGAPQPQVHVSRPSGSGTQDRNSAVSSEAPKTANIRPIASSPAAIKPQPVSIQPPSMGIKATASIRPMAITPTTVNPPSTASVTPTATVMPTTVSQQDLTTDDDGTGPVQQLFSAPGATSRPTQHVGRVIPQAEASQETTDPVTEMGMVEPQPSTSRDTPSTKRQREDTESPGEDSNLKRVKVTEEYQQIPTITVTSEGSEGTQETDLGMLQEDQDDITVLDIEQVEEDGEEELEIPATEDQHEEEEEEVEQEEEDDVIYVESNEDEEEDEYQEEEGDTSEDEDIEESHDEEYGEEEDVEEEQEEDYTEDMTGEMDGYQGNSHDNQMQTGQDQEDDDDEDVVIVEDNDDDDNNGNPIEVSQAQTTGQPAQTPSLPLPPPLQHAAMMERQISANRNQLTPFMLGGNPSAFEDGDDCMVPSTPTLLIPRRGDGFAEAVSSPQVHQRFTFGSGGEQIPTLSGLAQLETQAALGMGMDDTRMDLTQLEEASARSVPSTPQYTSASATSISDVRDTAAADTGAGGDGDMPEILELAQAGEVEGEEGDGEGLEGAQGEEETEEEAEIIEGEEEKSQDTGEGETEAGDQTGHDGAEPGSSQGSERSQDGARPRIQRIKWESPPTSAPPPTVQPPQQMSHPQTIQPHYRGAQRQRGTPPMRVHRGNFHRGQGSGGPTRRPMRGRGMYQRRPPMY